MSSIAVNCSKEQGDKVSAGGSVLSAVAGA